MPVKPFLISMEFFQKKRKQVDKVDKTEITVILNDWMSNFETLIQLYIKSSLQYSNACDFNLENIK